MDLTSKTIFASFFVLALREVDYFRPRTGSNLKVSLEDEAFVGKVLLNFIEGFQFNTHRVDSVYTNRYTGRYVLTRREKLCHRQEER